MTSSRSTARSTSSRPPLRMASWSRMWPWTRTLSWLDTQMQAGQMRRSQDHRLVWSLAWRIRRPWVNLQSLQCWTGNPRGLRGCVGQRSLQKLLQEMRQQIGALLQTFSCRSSSTWNQLTRWAISWLGFKPQMPSRSTMQCWVKIQTWATRGRWCLSERSRRWLLRIKWDGCQPGFSLQTASRRSTRSWWSHSPSGCRTQCASSQSILRMLRWSWSTLARPSRLRKTPKDPNSQQRKHQWKITCKPFDMSEDHWLFGDRVHGSKGPLS